MISKIENLGTMISPLVCTIIIRSALTSYAVYEDSAVDLFHVSNEAGGLRHDISNRGLLRVCDKATDNTGSARSDSGYSRSEIIVSFFILYEC
jgi:hypothetical protein